MDGENWHRKKENITKDYLIYIEAQECNNTNMEDKTEFFYLDLNILIFISLYQLLDINISQKFNLINKRTQNAMIG
jgi:hypothetical protein